MKQKTLKTINVIIMLLIAANFSYAQKKQLQAPDLANVKYGEHERHVMDVWFANKSKTTPLAIYIHGGGFMAGSKEKISSHELAQLLEAGISVASINYRYKSIAPLPAAHNDAKQALQFIRSKAEQWPINKDKVAIWGGSAGAQICMWLAFSDEMANAESTNPIERESTRVTCVATRGGQTTMESDFWLEHIRKYDSGSDTAFTGNSRLRTFGVETLEEANEIAKSISALSLISADDPPIFMQYSMPPNGAAPSKDNLKKLKGWIVHHVTFGINLKEKMDELNVEAHLQYPGSEAKYKTFVKFFTDKLLEE
ncbi:MAG: alpha/beta hydrolase [Bacteroidales bacterium]|nr:alpha/beta hydrolase [Bacteroidales bacterium]